MDERYYWVVRYNNEEDIHWEQVIAGPLSSADADVVVRNWASEPAKNEYGSRFSSLPNSILEERVRLGYPLFWPNTSQREITAFRLRQLGAHEHDFTPCISNPDLVAFDTLGRIRGILKQGDIFSVNGIRVGGIEKAQGWRYWVNNRTGGSNAVSYIPTKQPDVAAVKYLDNNRVYGYVTPDGVVHRLHGNGQELGFVGTVMPLESDIVIRAALAATLVGLVYGLPEWGSR